MIVVVFVFFCFHLLVSKSKVRRHHMCFWFAELVGDVFIAFAFPCVVNVLRALVEAIW